MPAQPEPSRHPWSWLLARIFAIEILKCPVKSCSGEMKVVEVARTPEHAARARRFPLDFAFQLTPGENEGLKSQIVTSKDGRGGRRNLPRAFTEQGVAMLSSVLHSERAIDINIEIMRAFVKLRRLMAFEAEIRQRFEAIEHKAGEQDAWIGYLYQAIEDLMKPPDVEPKRVGFRPNET